MRLLEGRASLGLVEAAGAFLGELAGSEPRLAVVTGRRPGIGEAFAQVAPERWVAAPGRRARLSVGAGLALAGWPAVVWCEDSGDAATAPWGLCGPLVAATTELEVAEAAWAAGVPVLAPAWPLDVGPLLLAGVERGPACLLLHGLERAPSPPLALDPLSLDAPRTVTHGPAGRVAAAGALMPPLLEAAWRLARAGRAVTAEQLGCLGPQGPRPAVAAGHVFWDDGGRWEPLPVASGDFREVEEAVAARLGR